MNGRKLIYALVLVVSLVASGLMQNTLTRQRETLGLTRTAVISNAPPVLAFTTVALGGFRGLIANALWIRTTQLQEEGKYFEAVQLADWITTLQPHFSQVWLYQSWNMAYNISVKFPNLEDRWLWVQRGIELLRDQGLRYNPNQALMYRELAWLFQHKMGANLDDARWQLYSFLGITNRWVKIAEMDRSHGLSAGGDEEVELEQEAGEYFLEIRNRYSSAPATRMSLQVAVREDPRPLEPDDIHNISELMVQRNFARPQVVYF